MMTTRTQLSAVAMLLLAATATAFGRGTGGRYWLPATGGFGTDGFVSAALAWDPDGPGPARPALYIGGGFTRAGGIQVGAIASWDGRDWSSLGGGMAGGGIVNALAVYPPSGLIAGGNFSSAGGQPGTGTIAAWNGSGWSSLRWTGTGSVTSLATVDPDGDGPSPLYLMAATSVDLVFAWNEFRWLFTFPMLGTPQLATFDADGAGPGAAVLLAGGTSWPGDTRGLITMWGGPSSEQWWLWGGGYFAGHGPLDPAGTVAALAAWDPDGDGPGAPLLVAAGAFDGAPGDVPASSIAAWDGAGWSSLGAGLTKGPSAGLVLALASFDPDGPGPLTPLLIAGGYFDRAGGLPASNIAAWDGVAWSPLGGGLTSPFSYPFVRTLTTFDPDGPGPREAWLVAGGEFLAADGRLSPYLALWGFCPTDLTQDGLVDFADYLEFLNAYDLLDLRVDYTGDGLVDFADYLEFLNLYEAGC